ncbi:MAG: S8 family serine peptidase [Acidobacteriota bacterium]
MARKKVGRSQTKNKAYTIQRGGEDFEVVEAAAAFAVKRKQVSSSGDLAAVAQAPDRFPGLRLDEDRSPRGLELYYVEAGARDSAMDELRENSPDVAWCSHVFHTPDDSESMLFPMDAIYVELKPSASDSAVNKLLDQYGLEFIPDPSGDPHSCVMRLTSESTKNPLKIANALRKSRAVVLAEPDLAVKGSLMIHRPSDNLFSLQWHLENRGGFGLTAGADISATEAWDITRGSRDITVAVIDDGFDTGHPDFASSGKIRSPRDFGQGDTDPSPVSSQDNHGTACAGVAVADENGRGVVGMAPECGLMPIRWSGSVSDTDIREQFDHPRLNGADVISCSWGVTSRFFTLSTSMKRSISKAATEGRSGKGCVILFAAGNDNRDIDDPPRTRDGFAIHPDVIAVAASNSRDKKSHYSNFGDAIWVCAPSSGSGGLGIVTTDRRGASGYQSGNFTTVERFGGTSSATPLVAGVCALMLSVNPELTAEEVKEILKDTAEKIDRPGGDYDNNEHSRIYGFGRVDAHRAVQAARDRRTTGGTTELRFESNPGLAIPDNQPAGVADVIRVDRSASVETVRVEVDITHTFRGDLQLTLISPQGTNVRLFGRTAPGLDGVDNLVTGFDVESVPALASLSGESTSGNWTLQVADLAAVDVGTLNSWTLALGFSTRQTEWHIAPGLAIPDNDATGITSELNVDAGGLLEDVAVSVDITHTFRGDLSIAVQAPSGDEVTLKSSDASDGIDDLRQTFNTVDTPELREFVERSIDRRGTWKLHVKDNLSADIGKLNAWSLKLST